MKKAILILSIFVLGVLQLGCKNTKEVGAAEIPIDTQSEAVSTKTIPEDSTVQATQLSAAMPTMQLSGDVQTMKKTLEYGKDITGYKGISLPFVVGDVNVRFTDTSNLKVNVDVIVDGNDESYQKSMLNDLYLKLSSDETGEVEIDPYRGDNMLLEGAADYNRKKCLVKMNYSIQIPKFIKNINIATANGTINSDSIDCDKLNIKTVGGKFISKGIVAKEMALNATSSEIKIDEKVTCDNMKIDLINANLEMKQFEGGINGNATSSTCTISNGIFKSKSNIKHIGEGNMVLGIEKMSQDSSLFIKSYTGDVNIKMNENVQGTLNYKHTDTMDKGTKLFNGGGPEINVELSGGKLVV